MGCTAITAPVYNGRDNIISLILEADGQTLTDLSPLTRAVVDLDGTQVVDSAIAGSSVIWWTDSVNWRGVATDVLRLQLGDQALTAGTYEAVEVTIYDATYLNGLRVENPIKLTVTA